MKKLLTIGAIALLLALPAGAQLNHQKIQQNAEGQIHNAGQQQQQTQQTINTSVPTAPSQAVGTVLSLEGDMVIVNQQVAFNGQTLTVKNRFYKQPSTRFAEGFKLAPGAKVKIYFATASDGRRMIVQIGP